MNDEAIITLFERRSEQGIAEATRAYGSLLRSIARHILRDDRDAEECVSDTMLKAWNTIPPAKPVYFSAYLAKITRNLALNRWNADHAQMRGSGEIPLVLEELAECIPSGERTDQVLDKMAFAESLEQFLSTIPPLHRAVFMRRYFSMMPVRDIAEALEINENTVKSILKRTRAKLEQHLEKENLL